MAETHTLFAKGVTFAPNKCLASIFNNTGSGKVIRLYRAFIYNNQVVAVTGVLTNIELRKLSAASGGTAITPLKNDTTNATLPAQVICGTNQTVTPTDVYRRILWSTDEPVGNATINMDEVQTFHSFCCVWAQGYGDASVEPIILREGEGVALINTGASAGQCDVNFEFTSAAT